MNTEVEQRIIELRKKIVPILKQYPVVRAGFFGSVVSDSYNSSSDIDLLIELKKDHKLGLEFVTMKNTLEDVTGKKVDLIQYNKVRNTLKSYILPNEVRIYG